MNKNKYILLGAVVLGLGLTSCSDFLNVDRYFRDQQSTERIFSGQRLYTSMAVILLQSPAGR